jgi:hypothetical protein
MLRARRDWNALDVDQGTGVVSVNDSGASGDVPASDSKFSIISSHGGVDGHVIGCVNYVLKLAANDYLELIWSTTNVAASIQSLPSSPSGPAHPSIPGIILTAVQVA